MSRNHEDLPTLVKRRRQHNKRNVLTPRQLRAARSLIGWQREQLAKASGVSAVAIGEFERGATDAKMSTVNRLRRAMEKAGVIFIDEDGENGPGVRLKGKRKD